MPLYVTRKLNSPICYVALGALLFLVLADVLLLIFEADMRGGSETHGWRQWLLSLHLVVIVGIVFGVLFLRRQYWLAFDELDAEKRNIEQEAVNQREFFANMSHEIRTPLVAVLGFASRLSKSQLEPDQEELVTRIRGAGDLVLSLANNILDVSRIESGMVQPENTPFSLRGLVQSVSMIFDNRDTTNTLSIDIDPDLPEYLEGDPIKLTQVLNNLVGNAHKFTTNGNINLSIWAEARQGRQISVAFEVSDTGIGIPPEKQASIFERYQQADSTTNRMYGGSGLGLYIVKKLVEVLKGSISLKSAPNQGSTFTVVVPLLEAGDYQEVKSNKKQEDHVVFCQHSKVLLVEDNPISAGVTGMMLNDFGVPYDLAENGLLALDMLKLIKYDLVLMDIQMPDLDGYKTAEAIRGQLRLNIPIVATSAYYGPEEQLRAIQSGFNDSLLKPYSEEQLLRLLQKYLRFEISTIVRLASATNVNDTFQKEMTDTFVQLFPKELLSLKQAVELHQWSAAASVAHSMRTTTGYMGLQDDFWPLLSVIEEAIGTAPPTDEAVQTAMRKIEEKGSSLLSTLTQYSEA